MKRLSMKQLQEIHDLEVSKIKCHFYDNYCDSESTDEDEREYEYLKANDKIDGMFDFLIAINNKITEKE